MESDGTRALYRAVEVETIIHALYRRATVYCALDRNLLVFPELGSWSTRVILTTI